MLGECGGGLGSGWGVVGVSDFLKLCQGHIDVFLKKEIFYLCNEHH